MNLAEEEKKQNFHNAHRYTHVIFGLGALFNALNEY